MNNYESLVNRLISYSPSARPSAAIPARRFINNADFGEWNDHIVSNLKNRDKPENTSYLSNGDIPLLEHCVEYANKHSMPLNSKNVVVLGHPLYPFISHANMLTGNQDDLNKYKANLIQLFNSGSDIVLFDTAHHFADSSSILLKEGVVKQAFFTHYDNGWPVHNADLASFGCNNRMNNDVDSLKGNKLYCGGTYNEGCLSSLINQLSGVVGKDNLYAINDVVLDYPLEGSAALSPRYVWDGKKDVLPDDKVIALGQYFMDVKK